MEWLEHYTFPVETGVNENPTITARKVYSSVVSATLAHGTTTALYFATTGEVRQSERLFGSAQAISRILLLAGKKGLREFPAANFALFMHE
jgi:hypothetical protein